MIFAQPFAPGTPVFAVGLRPTTGTSDRAAFTADVEIQMSSTASVPGALSATFASNIGSDMVVAAPRQMFNIPAMPANRPTSMFARFPFAAPFVYGTNGNTNINVDMFVYGRSTGASWSTDRGFASANGRATTVGTGCGGATIGSTSTGGTYVSGATVNLTLSGAPATTPAVLQASVDMSEAIPGLALPFDLAALGAGAGCDILVGLALAPLPFATDAAGAATATLPVPPVVSRVGTGWQWVYLAPNSPNPFPFETTANRAIWFGPEVIVPGAQYVWDLSNVAATTGINTTDSVPIVEFMIP